MDNLEAQLASGLAALLDAVVEWLRVILSKVTDPCHNEKTSLRFFLSVCLSARLSAILTLAGTEEN